MSVKIGIIGFGYMGHYHMNKIRSLSDAELTSVFDISTSARSDAESEGLKAFDNLEDFLKEPTDLVVISTPNNVHAVYAIAAMKAGKNVMSEKPVTMSVSSMKEIMDCSKATGKIFTVHQNRRWNPDYLSVCDVVKSGSIGKITTIESNVFGERGVCFGWRGDPVAGGGMLYDWGVHLIDQLLMLFKGEKVTSVYARLLSVLTPAVDDYFELQMQFENGTCGKVTVGTFALQKKPRWFVFGDRGTMKLDDFSCASGGLARIKQNVTGFDSVVGAKSLGPSRTMAPLEKDMLETLEIPQKEEDIMAYWINLVAAVKGEEECIVKQEEVLRQMQIVEAAFESSNTNRVIMTSI